MRKIAAILLGLLTSSLANASSDFQTWVPINTNINFTESLRGFFEFQPRIVNGSTQIGQFIVRPAIGWAFKETDYRLTAWAGYMMQATEDPLDTNKYYVENRAWQGISWKDTTSNKQFIYEIRNRLEERFLPQTSDVSVRWRTRFRGEYLIPSAKEWSIIASEEIFIDLNDNSRYAELQAGANQNRAYLGVGYRFSPMIQVESGYLNQQVWNHGVKPDANNNVWMTSVNLNF